jgi:hypothetical protein
MTGVGGRLWENYSIEPLTPSSDRVDCTIVAAMCTGGTMNNKPKE